MKLGVVFPQIEIGPDPGGVKAFAQATEEIGYDHLMVYDHVLGAGLTNRPNFRGAYSAESLFHEIFVLLGYLAGQTERLEFVTGVVILPQRQTALVAKQAAEVDRLSNGRLRLGVGIGWNEVEYIGLNENFRNRGKRSEEQIQVMRELWTKDVVDFKGNYHHIPGAGIKPLPTQQPIPVWIGGTVPAVMDRIGRLADGWFPQIQPGPQLDESLEQVAASARDAGRDPESIQMEGRINLTRLAEDEWIPATEAWRDAGASHLSIVTMGNRLDPDGHIDLMHRYWEMVTAG